MKGRARLVAWTAALWGGVALVLAAFGLAIVAGLHESDQQTVARVLEERAALLAFAALLLVFACGGAAKRLIDAYPNAIAALAEQTRVIVGANPELRVRTEGAREVAEAAAAVNRLADAWREAMRDAERRGREAAARLEEERNRLAALMAELSEGVVVCNADGRILLYNERARALLASAGTPVGLGRSLFGLLDRAQIAHALDKLAHRAHRCDALPTTRFVTVTAAQRPLRVRIARFAAADEAVAGFVLTLEDVSDRLGEESARRALLHALAAGMRAPVANLRAAAENLHAFPDMAAEDRARFVAIVAGEARALSQRLDEAVQTYARALVAGLALEETRVADLLELARVRIAMASGMEVETHRADAELWIRADSFALVQAFAFLAGRLAHEYGLRRIVLRACGVDGHVGLDLAWRGAAVPADALARWENEPMRIGSEPTPLALHDVLERHGGEAWQTSESIDGEGGGRIRFLLPAGEAERAPAPRAAAATVPSRPEYYDFDLFRAGSGAQVLGERPLAELSYTVFDTETTGLEPSAGDEIVAIGAVRVVNGRVLKGEVFETLVNPRRPPSRESVKVHGIEPRLLVGEPPIEQVLPAFRRFCEDTVLVAHNAAFDMRFLELKEAASGVRFDLPVLDTLLLSAVLHPAQADHSLEAIAERLGVPVIGRHTALGDALVTAEIFVRLVPLLAERGIVTLAQALDASRETWYARAQY